ncbi:TetR family transcriptional regulator [Streptomyces mashuensis]|uniref:TetR family transcriptional regulator n=1 Tax=Streptomyces mashuensis TaxID=33904 RepID=A0A919E790_9ACTN|nr:TetR family transcriptional regulator C-terminal domain-containing protein [Streptomyces mashuensis]GHF25847.1 TetR family transcriptional regulator [Streptomyces mashuensis]
MPKIVDREARRQAVADAVLRVAAREGLEHASLRNVAEEAGLAVGSVRHYFDDHSELMLFAMGELSRSIGDRCRAHVQRLLDAPRPGGSRRADVERLLAEFLPLDDERREEAALWLAFTTAARLRPALRRHADELHAAMDDLLTRVLDGARRAGRVAEDADLPVEVRRLSALLDGLTVQAVAQPGRVTPEAMRQVLRRHLESLVTAA